MKKFFLLLIVNWQLSIINIQAQDQHLFDSLQTILRTGKQDTLRANILYSLSKAYWSNNFDMAMEYATQCLTLSEQIGYKKGIGNAYNSMAIIKMNKGDYSSALEFHSKAKIIRTEIGDKKGIAGSYGNIGLIYDIQGNYPEALKNQFASLKINEDLNNKEGIESCHNNIGIVYMEQGNYKEALENMLVSMKICEEIGDKKRISDGYITLGIVYTNLGNYEDALKNYSKSLTILQEIKDKTGISRSFQGIGNIYTIKGNFREAMENLSAALKIDEEMGDKEGIVSTYKIIGELYTKKKKYKEASLFFKKANFLAKEIGSLENVKNIYKGLTELDSVQGSFNDAFENYKLYIYYRDSLVNNENSKKTVQLQMNYEFEKKQDSTKAIQDKKDAVALKELQKQKYVRNGFIGGFAVVLLFAGVFFTQRNKIKIGKQRSDELLLNILPSEVAEELKAKGSADAKQFNEVTVMFTDFKGFTQLSEKLSPTELVNEIHTCFREFDNIISKNNIEKIKTIGDSYMCAGGLPVANKTNAMDVVNAAIEIQQFMLRHLQQRKSEGKEPFEIRIGIHTGPVIAGIVGVKKFAYDIWGDTVNIASRMESSGEAGKVNISGSTYELVKDKFNCTHRGKIQAKNKGEIDMYFVENNS